mmetsp:Transcript_9351/g.20834  ORF Transcript_9351/g.20834 Transcript_9351/m.20834 type:complete len:322 (-) Transcript_9351:82-1047(-)|eukprot:CAMPEP_0170591926 /NCGR_PEP_ID=MMETSP0224-20130122/12663_1 /TAXON_ID=285029 /ORGANISM="Togula jolla, Strain CCCM 725" /LENGTH=321 /DNA_ID=CAMNT_0010915821 /DNA_START=406 /DNA_END=1371 /DNA_ORIENTATION=-
MTSGSDPPALAMVETKLALACARAFVVATMEAWRISWHIVKLMLPRISCISVTVSFASWMVATTCLQGVTPTPPKRCLNHRGQRSSSPSWTEAFASAAGRSAATFSVAMANFSKMLLFPLSYSATEFRKPEWRSSAYECSSSAIGERRSPSSCTKEMTAVTASSPSRASIDCAVSAIWPMESAKIFAKPIAPSSVSVAVLLANPTMKSTLAMVRLICESCCEMSGDWVSSNFKEDCTAECTASSERPCSLSTPVCRSSRGARTAMSSADAEFGADSRPDAEDAEETETDSDSTTDVQTDSEGGADAKAPARKSTRAASAVV